MTLFTDWTHVEPRYFWCRGAIWGIVFATILWKLIIPKIQQWRQDRAELRMIFPHMRKGGKK